MTTLQKKKDKRGRKGFTKKFTKEKILKAIENSGGILSTIAERLKCDWHTAQKYVNLYPETRQSIQDEEETNIDNAESVILMGIQDRDLQAAKYLLSTKGKRRGWVERQEVMNMDDNSFIEILKRAEQRKANNS